MGVEEISEFSVRLPKLFSYCGSQCLLRRPEERSRPVVVIGIWYASNKTFPSLRFFVQLPPTFRDFERLVHSLVLARSSPLGPWSVVFDDDVSYSRLTTIVKAVTLKVIPGQTGMLKACVRQEERLR